MSRGKKTLSMYSTCKLSKKMYVELLRNDNTFNCRSKVCCALTISYTRECLGDLRDILR